MNLCRCGLPAKIVTSWTDNNPGRRFFGCPLFKKGRHCDYFDWFDEGVVDGWPKEALIRDRDKIREKDKVINQLTTQLMELRLELDKHKVEISSEGSEDENNFVESDHKVGWMQKILGKMSISNA
ncbi:unnamed protein product [Arabidopsis halleri]